MAVAIVCVAVAIFVVRSAFTSGVPQGADSFAAADKNGDGSLDKAEFVSFVKAAKLGTPASDAQKSGVKICPKTGKVCKHSAEGGMEGGCCGGEGMSMKGEGGCCGGEGMGMKGEGGCCGGEGMGMKGGAKGKAGMKSCCSGEGAAEAAAPEKTAPAAEEAPAEDAAPAEEAPAEDAAPAEKAE